MSTESNRYALGRCSNGGSCLGNEYNAKADLRHDYSDGGNQVIGWKASFVGGKMKQRLDSVSLPFSGRDLIK